LLAALAQAIAQSPGNAHKWRRPVKELKEICDQQIRLTIDVDPLNLL
jgi:hypothetical protein